VKGFFMADIPKGLESLLGRKPSSAANQVQTMPVDILEPNPYQPRQDFSEVSLNELASSIRRNGLIQPIVVSQRDDKYFVIAGERRLRAAKLANLTHVPVVFREASERDMLLVALIENLNRDDLNPVDEAWAYKRLSEEFNLTQQDIADHVSKSRSHVANSMRLLGLTVLVQNLVSSGRLSGMHARILLQLKDADVQDMLAVRAVKENLSVRQLEALVGQLLAPRQKKTRTPSGSSDEYKVLAADLTKKIGRRIWIQAYGKKGKEKGRVSVEFQSPRDYIEIQSFMLKYLKK